ncbi:MAG TPA: thioredoxin [Anaerolineales bacterium]|nr:thioredoxin [Anaerolineales bacterium]
MSEMLHINQEAFPNEVLQADKPVLVDFGAVWCGPCKMLDPVVEQLAGEWGNKVKVVKIDVDNDPELAIQYQVLGVPTLILFVGGKPRERISGFKPKKQLQSKFEPYFN